MVFIILTLTCYSICLHNSLVYLTCSYIFLQLEIRIIMCVSYIMILYVLKGIESYHSMHIRAAIAPFPADFWQV